MSIIKTFSKDRKNCKVTFTLPKEAAPKASEIKVVGDFNNWSWEKGVKMKALKNEYKGQITLPTGKNYEFRYQIDGQRWENDWSADDYVPALDFPGIENSVAVIPNGTKAQATAPKATAAKSSATKTTAAKKTASKATAKTTSKATKKSPVKRTKKLDFTVIEGVGPKINLLLKDAGFQTFSDLAKAKPKAIKEVLTNAGKRFSMHDPKTWPKQSELASNGNWDELKKLQEQLKGGK